MTPEQYQRAIDRLELSQVGASKFLRVDPRTSRRWASGELAVPHAVDLLLTLMVKRKIRPEDLDSSLRRPSTRPASGPNQR